jgi:hypothetical protein
MIVIIVIIIIVIIIIIIIIVIITFPFTKFSFVLLIDYLKFDNFTVWILP